MVLDALAEFRRIQNANNLETFDQATDSLEAIRDWLVIGGGGSPGLCYYGIVTAVPGANQFTCAALLGLGDDKFLDLAGKPYQAYVLRDVGGAAAAPQGETRPITDYVSATGTFTTLSFSAAVAVGDEVLIMHPALASANIEILGFGTLDTSSTTVPADSTRAATYAWENNDYHKGAVLMPLEGNCRFQPRPIRGYVNATGVFTLDEPFTQLPGNVDYLILRADYPAQRLVDIQALLTSTEAAGPYSYLDAGGEQTVYQNEVNTRRRISFEMDLNTMTQNGTIRLYRRVDGANYRLWIEEAFVAAGNEKVFTREGITTNQYFRVTYQEAVDEGAARAIPYNVIIEALE